MLMLIMMVIRGGPLSCKANVVLLQAAEKDEWAFPHPIGYANGRSLTELMFIHAYGINWQTQSKL